MNDTVELWVDAQLSPALAPWIEAELGVRAQSASRLGLRDATDEAIFAAARKAGAIVLTKDADFVRLLATHGPPPRVVWLTFGNTSNARARGSVLDATRGARAAGDGRAAGRGRGRCVGG